MVLCQIQPPWGFSNKNKYSVSGRSLSEMLVLIGNKCFLFQNVFIKIEVSGELPSFSREIFCYDQLLWRLWSQHKIPIMLWTLKMNTEQKNFMGMDQEISRWKNMRVINHPQAWPEDYWIVELYMTPKLILPSGLSSLVCHNCSNNCGI